jgi:hypothetical protein
MRVTALPKGNSSILLNIAAHLAYSRCDGEELNVREPEDEEN